MLQYEMKPPLLSNKTAQGKRSTAKNCTTKCAARCTTKSIKKLIFKRAKKKFYILI